MRLQTTGEKLSSWTQLQSDLVSLEFRPHIRCGLLGLWAIQSESFRQKNPLADAAGCARFLVWYLFYSHTFPGATDYTLKNKIADAILFPASDGDNLSSLLDLALPDGIKCQDVLRPALFFYTVREDLMNYFDPSNLNGAIDLYKWCISSKVFSTYFEENKLVRWYKYLSEPSEMCPQSFELVSIPITRLMYFYWTSRKDLISIFDIYNLDGLRGYIDWWLHNRISVLEEFNIDDQSWVQGINEPYQQLHQQENISISRLMHFYLTSRKDLISSFDIYSLDGLRGYIDWWTNNIPYSIPVIDHTQVCRNPYNLSNNIAVIAKNNVLIDLKKGVNLIGLSRGELGIGEDVRMAAKSLVSVGVPFGIFNFPFNVSCRSNDHSADDYIESNLNFKTNLFCLPANETLRAYYEIGPRISEYYNIGYWPWEFSDFPEVIQNSAFHIVDEIWASTEFIACAARKATNKPVLVMPMAVSVAMKTVHNRSYFGLPDDSFLFIFAFDGNSNINRKNPLACVDAFLEAFPAYSKHVGLVIKAMNTENVSNWPDYIEKITAHPGIYLIDKTMDRGEILGLIDVCDAFISLHRSEGFGRGLAEAMLLDKPVIATNFSGNTDFTRANTAFLVEGNLEIVLSGQYPYHAKDLFWMTPSTELAAQKMRECFYDSDKRSRLSKAAKKLIETRHSFEAVGNSYKYRLKTLDLI